MAEQIECRPRRAGPGKRLHEVTGTRGLVPDQTASDQQPFDPDASETRLNTLGCAHDETAMLGALVTASRTARREQVTAPNGAIRVDGAKSYERNVLTAQNGRSLWVDDEQT